MNKNYYNKMFKRSLDILFSIILLIFLSPIFLLVAILIKLRLGNPVIFRQMRPGLNEKIFVMYKFRTMTNRQGSNKKLLSDEERLTRLGKLLRSTSLDELPELWNILKGEMSFVGPRPLLVEYLPLYNVEQRTRHNVRPGLTGLAQISGRNSIGWKEKFNLDIKYVKNVSFKMDVSIVFLTFKKVIIREGISSDNQVTTERFKGNEDDE